LQFANSVCQIEICEGLVQCSQILLVLISMHIVVYLTAAAVWW